MHQCTCSADLWPEEHQLYSQPVGGQLQQVRVELLGVAKFLTLAVVRFHCSYLPITCHHVVSDHNDDDDDDDDDEVTETVTFENFPSILSVPFIYSIASFLSLPLSSFLYSSFFLLFLSATLKRPGSV